MNIYVVIPAYKVSQHIVNLINQIGSEVHGIIVVDDACPERTGFLVEREIKDPRVVVIYNEINMGVGGAVIAGYKQAIKLGGDIAVKIDGDGQMNPKLITEFIEPILNGEADYVKGNRFYNLEKIQEMPKIRLFGNAFLSFLTKLSSGYWDLFDPTNGYTAIHLKVASQLPFDKISKRYFFESDMLFRLNTLRAVAVDMPMDAKYENEISNLKVGSVIGEFFLKHCRNIIKRIFYNYYLRDMSLASIELPIGLMMIFFGIIYGSYYWTLSLETGQVAATGTIMLASITLILGLQFILAFLAYDISSIPKRTLHRKCRRF